MVSAVEGADPRNSEGKETVEEAVAKPMTTANRQTDPPMTMGTKTN